MLNKSTGPSPTLAATQKCSLFIYSMLLFGGEGAGGGKYAPSYMIVLRKYKRLLLLLVSENSASDRKYVDFDLSVYLSLTIYIHMYIYIYIYM